ncbi:hypothetical protein EFER_3200 [Escherichia fergusonii ATCC 35469]|uniref:Uncharacterized protein n=1 Tax=Escherichia fergusonii (strain ATCC 35469 / DSM 13698 / CCUG 18766 / IAM 14443 / JCM 21226 / LMG 7866 / NBRC 102419 / NCTC 12128 / CDC 0568-73) TaxID=585054 RepID=B7LRJ7_ESCF3|nr:hypothetical protein EFER_3200 [Escherichia fergusonii ATCC 35469]
MRHSCSERKQKMNNTRHLGRKLDDSLPDFATFVVSRFWKWGKRGDNQKNATKPDPLWR